MLADGVGRIEQTFHAFNQTSICGWVDGGITGAHTGSILVQLLLGLQQNQRGGRRGARGANGGIDFLVSIGNVSINRGSQLANARFQNTFCEVIQLHGEFGRGEVYANVLLVGDRQGRGLLVVVLNLQGGTVRHQSTVRQADTQGRTNLGTFNSEAVVVLTVNVTGKNQIVLQNLESFPGDHINCKDRIGHSKFPLRRS